jgi:hypothetical protein
MKCPKCNEELIYDDTLDECYSDDGYSEKVHAYCPKCPFEGKLWLDYRLVSEEWEEE